MTKHRFFITPRSRGVRSSIIHVYSILAVHIARRSLILYVNTQLLLHIKTPGCNYTYTTASEQSREPLTTHDWDIKRTASRVLAGDASIIDGIN